ncbi:hypothetical protein Y032_0142g2282 [Ancylostoma ceylanicum]|uniref:Uncharacterized protein n=1 Tax=Ancylostoma ceylanicum TaxID=53326 RepID=A0A016T2H9_9BILA|nr:hypothetical protein Y032_0142g2282 [Ancylostoma ceylanicum]
MFCTVLGFFDRAGIALFFHYEYALESCEINGEILGIFQCRFLVQPSVQIQPAISEQIAIKTVSSQRF